jgi:hypothetical protein
MAWSRTPDIAQFPAVRGTLIEPRESTLNGRSPGGALLLANPFGIGALATHSNLACAIIRGDAVIGAGRDDHPIVTEQLAEACGLGHGFLLQLSAAACRRER